MAFFIRFCSVLGVTQLAVPLRVVRLLDDTPSKAREVTNITAPSAIIGTGSIGGEQEEGSTHKPPPVHVEQLTLSDMP